MTSVGVSLWPVAVADCNANCVPDSQDISSGISADVNANGIPDECEVGLESTFGAPMGGAGTSFGRAVATDGATAVIGAPSAGTDGAGVGEAWVYAARSDSEWASTQRLRSSTPVIDGQFGIDAVLVGDRAIVGALSEGAGSDGGGTASGAIHIFTRGDAAAAFAHAQRIVPPDPTAGQAYGFGLSAWGDWLAVGAYNDDDGGDNAGAVYLYKFDLATGQYTFRQKLVPTDTAANQKFGVATDMIDGLLVVGAYRDGVGVEFEAGAAYVYELGADGDWSQGPKLQSSPPVPGAWFGDRVAMSPDGLVVTASKEPVTGVADGAAYVFARAEGGWIQTDRLEAPPGTGGAWFGSAATISGATLVIGGRGVTANGVSGGASFRYELDGSEWSLGETISPASPAAGANSGWAIDLAGGTLLVGSPGASQASLYRRFRDCDGDGVDDDAQLDSDGSDCNGNLLIDACEIDSGHENDCNANGVPDSCEIADGSATDYNANGVPDCCEDADSDGTPDCNDGCPDDPNKTAPGTCGCGVSDADSDADGTPDCNDGCPTDSNKTSPGTCGCGVSDADSDADGTPDCNDGCPTDPNKTSPGTCGCGVSDADTDADGTPDCNDACPSDPLKTEPGVCGCGVPESEADVWYPDADGDGYGSVGSGGLIACTQPSGWVLSNSDCDDNDPGINPGSPEVCGNTIDENCNGDLEDCVPELVGFVGEGSVQIADSIRYGVVDVYAVFDPTSAAVVNVYDTTIVNTSGGSFVQHDVVGGSWSPIDTDPSLASIDSFVTIGAEAGTTSGNTTVLDPNFGDGTSAVPPVGAGWYNSNPTNLQGLADPLTGRLHVGRFVTEQTLFPGSLSFTGWVTYQAHPDGEAKQSSGSVEIAYPDLECPWDIDGDGQVSGADIGLLLLQWGLESDNADFDGDGDVDGGDIGILLINWGPCL